MPVHTVSGNRHFGHEIGSTDGKTVTGSTTQRDPAYESVFPRNLLFVEQLTELLGLEIGRNGGCESHSKTLRTSVLNPSSCSRPCARSAVEVVPLWRRAVQTDLQDNPIAG